MTPMRIIPFKLKNGNFGLEDISNKLIILDPKDSIMEFSSEQEALEFAKLIEG